MDFIALAAMVVVSFMLLSAYVEPQSYGSSAFFTRTWGGSQSDSGNAVALGASGDIYVAGVTASFGGPGSRVLLLRYTHAGGLLWQKTWSAGNAQGATSLALDPSGNVYIGGQLANHALLLKVNSSGKLAWQRAWGNYTTGYSISECTSGGVYMTGDLKNNTAPVILVKFNESSGLPIWQEEWGSSHGGDSAGLGLALDNDCNIYVTGATLGFDIQYPNGTTSPAYCGSGLCHDSLLLKFNSTGSLLWERIWRISGTSGGHGSAVAVDASGDVYVVGSTDGLGLNDPYFSAITKFHSNGTFVWERNWRDSSSKAYGAAVDASGNLYVTGISGSDLLLLSLDSKGSLRSVVSWGGFPAGYGMAVAGFAVAVDAAGTPVVTGETLASPSGFVSHGVNTTLDRKVPTVASPSGVVTTLPDLSKGVTGILSDVQGNTTYSGAYDALLVYGSSFPVPTLAPLQLAALASGITLVTREMFNRYKTNRHLS